jgi:hypothetical protein
MSPAAASAAVLPDRRYDHKTAADSENDGHVTAPTASDEVVAQTNPECGEQEQRDERMKGRPPTRRSRHEEPIDCPTKALEAPRSGEPVFRNDP